MIVRQMCVFTTHYCQSFIKQDIHILVFIVYVIYQGLSKVSWKSSIMIAVYQFFLQFFTTFALYNFVMKSATYRLITRLQPLSCPWHCPSPFCLTFDGPSCCPLCLGQPPGSLSQTYLIQMGFIFLSKLGIFIFFSFLSFFIAD